MKRVIVIALFVLACGNVFCDANEKDAEVKAADLQKVVAEDQRILDRFYKLREEYVKKNADIVIGKQILQNIMKTQPKIAILLSITEQTDAKVFFSIPVKQSTEMMATEIKRTIAQRINNLQLQNKKTLEVKYPLCKVGDKVSVNTRLGVKTGRLRQISDGAIVVNSVRISRNDMEKGENLRFFEADRKSFLQKQNLLSLDNVKRETWTITQELYLSNGYLPVNEYMQLDFNEQKCLWISRKNVLDAEYEKNKYTFFDEAMQNSNDNIYIQIGFKTKEDFSKWRKEASERLLQLGRCHIYGDGMKVDEEKAFNCFNVSAELGNEEAMVNVGICYFNGRGTQKNVNKAFKIFELGSEKGMPKAMFWLANAYFYGMGVKSDKIKAISLFKKSANLGFAQSYLALGDCYDNGDGVQKNDQLSFSYFKKAAELGESYAQFRLGACYEFGHGINRDLSLAKEWYQRAMSNNNEEIAKEAKKALKEMEIAEEAAKKAIEEEKRQATIIEEKVIALITRFNRFANSFNRRLDLDDSSYQLIEPWSEEVHRIFPNGLKYYNPSGVDGYLKRGILQDIIMIEIDLKTGIKMLPLDLKRAKELKDDANKHLWSARQSSNDFLGNR